MVVKKSTKPDKKLMAIFTDEKGKTTTTHFGNRGSDDYLKSKDKELRKRYRARHAVDLRTKDSTRAGYLSYYILWGDSTSLDKNVEDYKKRFGYK